MVYGDILRGFSWRGRQVRVQLSTTAIFGDLSVYTVSKKRTNFEAL